MSADWSSLTRPGFWLLANGWERRGDKFWNKQNGEIVDLPELMDLYAEYCVARQFVSTSE